MHAQLRIDDGAIIQAHPARTSRVPGSRGMLPNVALNVRPRAQVRPNIIHTHLVERLGAHDFEVSAHTENGEFQVVRIGEIIGINERTDLRHLAGVSRDLCRSGAGDPSLRRGGAVDGAGGLRVAAGGDEVGSGTVTGGSRAGTERYWAALIDHLAPTPISVGDTRRTVVRPTPVPPGQKNCRRASASSLGAAASPASARFRQPGQPAGLPPDRRHRAMPRRPCLCSSVSHHRGDRRKAYDTDAILQAVQPREP